MNGLVATARVEMGNRKPCVFIADHCLCGWRSLVVLVPVLKLDRKLPPLRIIERDLDALNL